MPEPQPNESRDEFISRCVPMVLDEGAAEDNDQAVAICASMFDAGKAGRGGMEHKVVAFDVTAIDAEGRTIEGYASVFGNLDQGNDIVHRGAFAKTIAERGQKVALLWQHDQREPVGRILELREDERGLFVKALVSDTQRGRDALALMRDDVRLGMSIGYDPIKGGTEYERAADKTVRHLREVKLWEVSLVTFPMNEQAGVTALKEDAAKTVEQRLDELVGRVEALEQKDAAPEPVAAAPPAPPPAPEPQPAPEQPDVYEMMSALNQRVEALEHLAPDAGREGGDDAEGAGPPEAPTSTIDRRALIDEIDALLGG